MNRATARILVKDIKADCHTPGSCPIARAIRRVAGKRRIVVVSDEYSIGRDQYRRLPDKAVKWIKRYDHGFDVKPFTFVVTWNPKPYVI